MSLLNPIDVLSHVMPDSQSSDGPLIIADKKWLAGSIFPSVILTSAETCDLRPDVSSGEEVFCLEIPFTEKPLISSLTHFTAPLLNTYRLIDLATDALAKEIAKVPKTSDARGERRYSKTERLTLFHYKIIDRVRCFLLDELPETLVETLGHLPIEVYGRVWFDLPSYYQLMYLLSSYKAGFNVPFMYHNRLPVEGYYPEDYSLPLTSSTNWKEVRFYFDCGPLLDVDEGYDEDFYLPRYLLDFATNPEEKVSNNYHRFQFLSFKGYQPVKKSELCKQILAEGICYLAAKDLAHRFFAKEVVRRGVKCDHWRGIYKPAINLM
ncbi:TPA: hypothetical protein ACHY5N_005127 [Escherichia coli]